MFITIRYSTVLSQILAWYGTGIMRPVDQGPYPWPVAYKFNVPGHLY